MEFLTLFGLAVFAVFLIVILYLFYRSRVSETVEITEEWPKESFPGLPAEPAEKKKSFKFFKLNFLSKSPEKQKKLEFLRRKREHKNEGFSRSKFFWKFGFKPKKVVHTAVEGLEKVVKHHPLKENVFQKLEKLHQQKLEKEQKIIRLKEAKGHISKVKQLIRKK